MIDPRKFTDYNLDEAGLQGHILFAIAAAGKNAMTTARLLDELVGSEMPFKAIRKFKSQETLKERMRQIGFGCHTLKSKGFWWIANSGIDLKSCTAEELERCPGIGMKTSRFFIMHTRKNAPIAAIDTHILKYLRDIGISNVPNQTPTKKRYLELEKAFLQKCQELNIAPAVHDLNIWNHYAGHSANV